MHFALQKFVLLHEMFINVQLIRIPYSTERD